jgi:hypothetical protein
MSKWEKFKEQLMSGQSDTNISYDELCHWLTRIGFTGKQGGGSHNVFRQSGRQPITIQNLQGKAKPYQVRQIRDQLNAEAAARKQAEEKKGRK